MLSAKPTIRAHEIEPRAQFDMVKAPEKHLVWFEHSAHMPMSEEPGKFVLSLVRYARPIAEMSADVAPQESVTAKNDECDSVL